MGKVRLDFVTNSSSSSFVIMRKNEEENKELLVESALKLYETVFIKNSIVVKNKEDLDEYFVDMYGYGDESVEQVLSGNNRLTNRYEQYRERIVTGFELIFKTVDSEDCECELFKIMDSIDNGETVIVREDY